MVTQQTVERCREILERLARSGERLTYGSLMNELGIGRQELKHCLNPIYREEMEKKRPDLTLIVHYANKLTGLYNSGGAQPQTIVVDPGDAKQVSTYKSELRRVYQQWGGHPKGMLKEWLDA